MMNIMRIAMIGQKGIPITELGGGVERHVEGLSTRLVERGHDVLVYVRSHIVPSHMRKYRGVQLVHIPSIATKNFDTITHAFLSTLDALFQKVDIIHYHGVGPATMAWIPRIFSPRIKVVATFHSQDRFQKKWGAFARAYLTFGEWAVNHFPHATITVSHILTRLCKNAFHASPVYIPYAAETKHTRASDKLKKWNLKSGHYILTVARLVHHKGIHTLIEAYHGVPTDMKLVIVGAPSYTGDYLEYLKKLAAEHPNIIFTGFQSGETLAQLFSHAYMYVHPSQSEGLSNTILEAMSYGKCVLIADIPENMEAIDHVGYSFRRGNVKDLREKLTDLIGDPQTVAHHGARSRVYVRGTYNWERAVDATEAVYEKLLLPQKLRRHALQTA